MEPLAFAKTAEMLRRTALDFDLGRKQMDLLDLQKLVREILAYCRQANDQLRQAQLEVSASRATLAEASENFLASPTKDALARVCDAAALVRRAEGDTSYLGSAYTGLAWAVYHLHLLPVDPARSQGKDALQKLIAEFADDRYDRVAPR